jgi:hypothetical protein
MDNVAASYTGLTGRFINTLPQTQIAESILSGLERYIHGPSMATVAPNGNNPTHFGNVRPSPMKLHKNNMGQVEFGIGYYGVEYLKYRAMTNEDLNIYKNALIDAHIKNEGWPIIEPNRPFICNGFLRVAAKYDDGIYDDVVKINGKSVVNREYREDISEDNYVAKLHNTLPLTTLSNETIKMMPWTTEEPASNSKLVMPCLFIKVQAGGAQRSRRRKQSKRARKQKKRTQKH